MSNEPHAPCAVVRLAAARLAPRCNARSRRLGVMCRQPAMRNGKCRMHGGPSTGPRTSAGLERSRKARWKHGHYSAEAKAALREARHLRRLIRALTTGA